MRKLCFALFITLLLTSYPYPPLLAQEDAPTSGRDLAFEQEILDRLQAIDPAVGPLFQQATAATDAGDFDTAKTLFEQVLQLAPDFPDALRRLSHVEIRLGNRETALNLAQRAYGVDASPYNQMALAEALLHSGDSASEVQALQLVQEAAQALPDNGYTQSILLLAGRMNSDVSVVQQASEALIRIAPTEPIGHYYLGLALAENSEWERAEAELLLAQDLGWPAAEVERTLDIDISREANTQRLLRTGAIIILVVLIIISGSYYFRQRGKNGAV